MSIYTVTSGSMATEIFLDTSYVIALASVQDAHHSTAVRLAQEIVESGAKLVTTRAVLLEIGNALAMQQHRTAGVSLLDALESDSNVGIVPLTETLYRQAFDLYRNRTDKAWGLVDCVSFVVMNERGMTMALTADRHFEQAGCRALLR